MLFALVGWPWARVLFPRAPDGGTGLARIVTLIIGGWLTWFLASLKITTFSAVWSWIALGVTAVVGWVLWFALAERRRTFPKLVIGGAIGMAKIKRHKKEVAIQRAMGGCLRDQGYEIASWQKATKVKAAATAPGLGAGPGQPR